MSSENKKWCAENTMFPRDVHIWDSEPPLQSYGCGMWPKYCMLWLLRFFELPMERIID